MANHKNRDTAPDEPHFGSDDPADADLAATRRYRELNSLPAPARIIVAGDDYTDELEDTGEFLPLTAALIGVSEDAVESAGSPATDSAPTPPPEAPAAAVPSATANERAEFWLKHLESEIERLQQRWELIANELSSREQRIEQLSAEAHSQQATIDVLRNDINGRVVAAAALQTDLDAANARLAELVAAQAERDAALTQRDRELDETRERVAAQQAALGSAEATRDELLAALEQSRLETAEAAKRHTTELAASDTLRVKIQELEAYIDGRSSSWAAQNTKLTEYQNQLAALKTSAAATESRLLAQTAESQRLAAKLADAERDASTQAGRYRDSESERAELEKRLTEEAAATAAVRTDLVAAQRSRQDMAAELARREELATSLERGVLRRDQTIAELERALQRSRTLEAQLGTENATLVERAAELERTITHRDEQIRALQETTANAERSARESAEHSGTLERLLRDSAKELADAQDGLSARDELIARLKLDLRAKQGTLDLLEHNVHRLNDLGTRLEGMESTFSSTEIVSANLKRLPTRSATDPDGEIVDIGKPLEPETPVPTTGRMIIAVDGAGPRKYQLHAANMTIGRSLKSDIRILSPFISRFHARILQRDEETFIEDLGSKNGILVNSKPVERTASLHDGDIISLGGQLEFKYIDFDRRNGAAASR